MGGSVLEAKPSTCKPHHVLCQLGSGLHNVNDVKAVFRLSYKAKWEGGKRVTHGFQNVLQHCVGSNH